MSTMVTLEKRLPAAEPWFYPGAGHFYTEPQPETSPVEWVSTTTPNWTGHTLELRGATDRYARLAQGRLWVEDIIANAGNVDTIAKLHNVDRETVRQTMLAYVNRAARLHRIREARSAA